MPALAVLGEFKPGSCDVRMPAQKGEALAFNEFLRARLVVELFQPRLVLEQIKLRRRADHVQIDDLFRARRNMRWTRGQWICGFRGRRVRERLGQQSSQRHRAETEPGALEKLPARDVQKA